MTFKKTICLDFDGVIHSYTSGWKGEDVCNDDPVAGVKEAIEELRKKYVVKVYSSRCSTEKGYNAVCSYLFKHGIEVNQVCISKPPAIIYIDDRGIQFKGDWKQTLEDIENFEHWIKK